MSVMYSNKGFCLGLVKHLVPVYLEF